MTNWFMLNFAEGKSYQYNKLFSIACPWSKYCKRRLLHHRTSPLEVLLILNRNLGNKASVKVVVEFDQLFIVRFIEKLPEIYHWLYFPVLRSSSEREVPAYTIRWSANQVIDEGFFWVNRLIKKKLTEILNAYIYVFQSLMDLTLPALKHNWQPFIPAYQMQIHKSLPYEIPSQIYSPSIIRSTIFCYYDLPPKMVLIVIELS